MKAYILSIVAAAVVSAIAKGLLGNKTMVGKFVSLLCGIFIVVTVISPLRNIGFSGIADYFDNLSVDAQIYVDEGKSVAENQTADIIKSQVEAYVLEKAADMGLEITVEVELDGSNGYVPCAVALSGKASPYAQAQLATYIEDTLGIAKEKQKWN